MFISYAQNFEDVILNRALKSVRNGFYIDIGAQEPITHSVSFAFYRQGWRGVHVEPNAVLAEKLRLSRPDEIVLDVAVGAKTGLSTTVLEHHKSVDKLGYEFSAAKVKSLKTAELLDRFGDRDIHWLKIDVKGVEASVIEGWAPSPVRPWIIVVKSTKLKSPIPNHYEWEPALLALGYEFVYFDGLNRFYVSVLHPELKASFGPGPSVLDEFVLAQHMNDQPEHDRPYATPLLAEINELRCQVENVIGHHSAIVAKFERRSKKWRRPFHIVRDVGRNLRRRLKNLKARLTSDAQDPLTDINIRYLPADVETAYRRLIAARPIATAGKRNIQKKNRPLLAYFSPMPPTRSGISDYSAELIVALSRHYEIIIVSGHSNEKGTLPEGASALISVSEFCAEAAYFDRVLYHIGNSHYHCYMFPLMKRIPGVVVLHDFYIGNALKYAEQHGQPGVWRKSLYHSHGFRALIELALFETVNNVAFKYPVNLDILEAAEGVIVHSEHSRALARTFYRPEFSQPWAVIPSLRKLPPPVDRVAIRARLGFKESDFIVCSFGMLVRTKSPSLTIAAFNASLAQDETCHLVFVGELAQDVFGENLRRDIDMSAAGDRIRVTGFVDRDTYQAYLAIADVAVQLRGQSRGETSAAVRDCMGHGVATIVNAHGAMADLPNDAVLMVPDRVSIDHLAVALGNLRADETLRHNLGERARAYIAECCAPDLVAEHYRDAIEAFAASAPPLKRLDRLASIAAALPKAVSDPAWLASAIEVAEASQVHGGVRQIFVDVTAISHHDLGTGIQRVVRAQLHELIWRHPPGTRIEPVRLERVGNSWIYRYARNYTRHLFGLRDEFGQDDPIVARPDDILIVSDFHPRNFSAAARDGLFARLKARGVGIHVIVYDILPILRPEFFPPGADETHRDWLLTAAAFSDQLIGISRTVSEDVALWLSLIHI